MDIGQILGTTTEPPRRDNDSRREEGEEFANLLSEPAPKSEPSVKKDAGEPKAIEPPTTESTDSHPPAEGKTAQKDAAPETGAPTDAAASGQPEKTQAHAAASKGIGETSPVVADAAPVLPTPPAAAPAVAATSTKKNAPAAAASPVATAAQNLLNGAAAGEETPNTATVAKADTPVIEVTKKPATTETGTTKAEAVVAQSGIPFAASQQPEPAKSPKANTALATPGSEKVPAMATPETQAAVTPPKALDVVRAEAMAKMSEKDILSAKIAEMLQDGKGKISLVAANQQQSFQSTLASSTNLVTAAMSNNPAASVANGLPFAMADADAAAPTIATAMPVAASDAASQVLPTVPSGSVQGVEATAASNATQAANAARAAAQLPVAEQVSTHLSTAIKEGHDRIKINLHPSELGRVEVKLDIGHDGRILAVVSVDKQETLDLLQRDARSLERALQDAGFDTGSNSLNFGLRQNGQDSQGDGGNFANFDTPADDTGDDGVIPDLSLQSVASGVTAAGGLDIQV